MRAPPDDVAELLVNELPELRSTFEYTPKKDKQELLCTWWTIFYCSSISSSVITQICWVGVKDSAVDFSIVNVINVYCSSFVGFVSYKISFSNIVDRIWRSFDSLLNLRHNVNCPTNNCMIEFSEVASINGKCFQVRCWNRSSISRWPGFKLSRIIIDKC